VQGSVRSATIRLLFGGTHSELVNRAGSQCVWRDKHSKLLARATVAKRVCEDGGAWRSCQSCPSFVIWVLFGIPGRYASLITSYGRCQYCPLLLLLGLLVTHRAVHVLIDRHGVPLRYQSRVLWRSCEWYKGTRAASKSTFA
jgi:hypothetical protein